MIDLETMGACNSGPSSGVDDKYAASATDDVSFGDVDNELPELHDGAIFGIAVAGACNSPQTSGTTSGIVTLSPTPPSLPPCLPHATVVANPPTLPGDAHIATAGEDHRVVLTNWQTREVCDAWVGHTKAVNRVVCGRHPNGDGSLGRFIYR